MPLSQGRPFVVHLELELELVAVGGHQDRAVFSFLGAPAEALFVVDEICRPPVSKKSRTGRYAGVGKPSLEREAQEARFTPSALSVADVTHLAST